MPLFSESESALLTKYVYTDFFFYCSQCIYTEIDILKQLQQAQHGKQINMITVTGSFVYMR